MIQLNVGLDFFPLLAAVLAAIACGLLGNFLVLRRLSLMGDAISHSVLPGLVIAVIITSARDPLPIFIGAALAGIATVVLVEIIKRLGRVEPGAAMGVVFSVLFALGILLIETESIRHIDLDADCVLHGQLELLWWTNAPDSWAAVLSPQTLPHVPRQVWSLLAAAIAAAAFITVFFKELRIAAFDPALATTQGFSAGLLHHMLMVLVALATVASFEAVGSILVIAMLVCPAAVARLLTDRLGSQILVSLAVAIAAAVTGYIAANAVPAAFGKDAVNAAGSITVALGLLLALAMIAGPRHGLITRLARRRRLAITIARDDILAALFRAAEHHKNELSETDLRTALRGRPVDAGLARARRAGLVVRTAREIALTELGRRAAADLIRRHRLWETYLVERAGIAPDHVHAPAEQLEHLATQPPPGPGRDPHGRTIPQPDPAPSPSNTE